MHFLRLLPTELDEWAECAVEEKDCVTCDFCPNEAERRKGQLNSRRKRDAFSATFARPSLTRKRATEQKMYLVLTYTAQICHAAPNLLKMPKNKISSISC